MGEFANVIVNVCRAVVIVNFIRNRTIVGDRTSTQVCTRCIVNVYVKHFVHGMYVVRRHLQKLFDFGMKEMIGSKAPSGMSGGNRPWTMNLAKKSTNGNGDSVAGSRYEVRKNTLALV